MNKKVEEIANYANEMIENGYETKVAFLQALHVCRLKESMRNGVVIFEYEKLNGDFRTACGTLDIPTDCPIGVTKKEQFKSVPYFDFVKGGFRSFKPERLVRWNIQ